MIKKKSTSSYSTAHVKKTKINHLKKETGNKTDQEKLIEDFIPIAAEEAKEYQDDEEAFIQVVRPSNSQKRHI